MSESVAVPNWERHAGVACAPLFGYRRREPEKTVLYEVVRDHLESFLASVREQSASGRGLPSFVEKELRGYLDCGILARGFVRVCCSECGFERLVAFSCKGSLCPSCAARRMEETAAHLAENVFQEIPVRQWVLSLPRRLRFLAARQPKVASQVLRIFTRAVFSWLRRVARRMGVEDPRAGAVTVVQRFGGSLNLNVHFHTLVPDGVFDLSQNPARFVPVPRPRAEDLERILLRVIRRVEQVVAFPGEADPEPLATLQADSIQQRRSFSEPFRPSKSSVFLEGFSLHAGTRVHENDRDGLERLCRYAARPPLALERLSRSCSRPWFRRRGRTG